MEDAINGRLKVRELDEAALKFNRVKIKQGMEGVPIRPLFSDDGIAFEYMGDAKTPPKATASNDEKSKSSVTENLSNLDSGSNNSSAVPPASTSTRAGANQNKQYQQGRN